MAMMTVNGYYVAGNEFVAIAIRCDQPSDAHYFTQDENHPSAYHRAIAWTSPGL